MRAPLPRAFVCAALITAAPLACTKNRPSTNVTIAEDGDSPRAGEGARASDSPPARPTPRGDLQKVELSGSVFGVDDMLAAAGQLITMWSTPEPGAPPINLMSSLEVLLMQEGFGPGFLESLDLEGVHAGEFAYPHDNQGRTSDADLELRLSLSATQPVRALESLPATMRPQPIGQDIWQLDDNLQLLFRTQSDALEIAMSMPDLDLARGLRAKHPVGPKEPRIRMAASNLPRGQIDIAGLLPLPSQLARPISSILNETTAVDFAADFGSDRDLIGRVGATAPFERLGLDPIGPATQAASELAKSLPGDAVFVWLMPWGDPALLHGMLDRQIKADLLPAPFDGYVDEVVKGVHGVLGQIRGEVLVATYVDKGQVTIALAADVGDEKAAQAAMRAVWGAAEKAFEDHIAIAGNTPAHAYSVNFKQGAVKAGKAKADLFTLTVPKNKQDQAKGAKWFFGTKPKVEVSTLVSDGKLVVAMGAGQKSFMAALGRTLGKPGEGLEGGGLELARKVTDGCQYCVAIDLAELGELVFTINAGDPDEPEEVHKAAQEALKKLSKLGLDGEIAVALRLDKNHSVFGFGIPKGLLFSEPTKVKTLIELMESIDDARAQAWGKSMSSAVPGGVPGGN